MTSRLSLLPCILEFLNLIKDNTGFPFNETTALNQSGEIENDGIDIYIASKGRLLVSFKNEVHIDHTLIILLCELLHNVCLSALADALYHKRLPVLCFLPFGQICFYLSFKHSFPRLTQRKNTFFQANMQGLLHFSERMSPRSAHFSERINKKNSPQITEIQRKTLPLSSQAFCNIHAGMSYRSGL